MADRFGRYVALGDSTTEGIDDPYPGFAPGEEVYRGWADRLAVRLAQDVPRFEYANLAIRGRLIAQIREQQLEPALAMKPDLASVVGGVNDLLRPGFDLELTSGHLESMVEAFRRRGVTVIMMTLPDLGDSMRVARIVSKRLAAYNVAIRRIAQRQGAFLADMASRLDFYDPRGWSPDRLHANDVGHEYLMWGAAEVLGLPEATEELNRLRQSAPPAPAQSLASELAWTWSHLRPWIMRRLKGTSSGDGVEPKRPRMQPLDAADLLPSE